MTPLKEAAPWRAHWALLLLTLMYGDNFVGRQVLAVMIEPIKLEFGASDTSMGLISGLAFAGVFAVLALPAGRLADRIPRIRLLAVSCLFWGVATILCGVAGSFLLLVAARMLVAATEAPAAPAALSSIADLYPPQRRAFAISFFTAAPTFAAVIALSLGAWLVDTYGWRTTFILVGAPAILIGLSLALFVREPERGRWDTAPMKGSTDIRLSKALATLWSIKPLRLVVIASALATLAGTAFGMWNATFLVRSHGLEIQHAGLLTGIIGGLSAGAGVMFGGWLSDRLGSNTPHRQLLIPIFGHLMGFGALVIYLLWPVGLIAQFGSVPVPAAMVWCAVNGFFMVWWMAPSFAMLTTLAPAHMRSTAMALQMLLNTILGVGIGPLLVGMFSDIMHPSFGIESLRYALLLVACSVLFSIVTLHIARRHFLKALN